MDVETEVQKAAEICNSDLMPQGMDGRTHIHTGCLALNYNKVKHYVSSTIKCTGKIKTFSNNGAHKVCVQ
jgi:hypothetical protein